MLKDSKTRYLVTKHFIGYALLDKDNIICSRVPLPRIHNLNRALRLVSDIEALELVMKHLNSLYSRFSYTQKNALVPSVIVVCGWASGLLGNSGSRSEGSFRSWRVRWRGRSTNVLVITHVLQCIAAIR